MPVFEELALIYDHSIDWNLRLQRELPFLLELIKTKKPARILDLACGSGRHAVALALEGHQVIGIDLSPQMINAATAHATAKGVNVHFYTADMTHTEATVEGPFDLIICLGNSLALLPTIHAIKSTIQNAHSLLKKQGWLLTQTLNFEEIRHSKFRFFPLKSGTTAAGNEVIFVRFFEPISGTNDATLIFTGFFKTNNTWKTQTRVQQLLQLSHPLMKQILRAGGFIQATFFADYQKHAFSATKSRNLITLAQK
jgi:2-polyprenyl-3-methyl-5-hydroxy-6-metoxy-1,4-benzoquinol methylase